MALRQFQRRPAAIDLRLHQRDVATRLLDILFAESGFHLLIIFPRAGDLRQRFDVFDFRVFELLLRNGVGLAKLLQPFQPRPGALGPLFTFPQVGLRIPELFRQRIALQRGKFRRLDIALGLVFANCRLDCDILLLVLHGIDLGDHIPLFHIVPLLEIEPDHPAVHMADHIERQFGDNAAIRIDHILDLHDEERHNSANHQKDQKKSSHREDMHRPAESRFVHRSGHAFPPSEAIPNRPAS